MQWHMSVYVHLFRIAICHLIYLAWYNAVLWFVMCQIIMDVDRSWDLVPFASIFTQKTAYMDIVGSHVSIRLCVLVCTISQLGRLIYEIYFTSTRYPLNRYVKFCWLLLLPWVGVYVYYFVRNVYNYYDNVTYLAMYNADKFQWHLGFAVFCYVLQLLYGIRTVKQICCMYKHMAYVHMVEEKLDHLEQEWIHLTPSEQMTMTTTSVQRSGELSARTLNLITEAKLSSDTSTEEAAKTEDLPVSIELEESEMLLPAIQTSTTTGSVSAEDINTAGTTHLQSPDVSHVSSSTESASIKDVESQNKEYGTNNKTPQAQSSPLCYQSDSNAHVPEIRAILEPKCGASLSTVRSTDSSEITTSLSSTTVYVSDSESECHKECDHTTTTSEVNTNSENHAAITPEHVEDKMVQVGCGISSQMDTADEVYSTVSESSVDDGAESDLFQSRVSRGIKQESTSNVRITHQRRLNSDLIKRCREETYKTCNYASDDPLDENNTAVDIDLVEKASVRHGVPTLMEYDTNLNLIRAKNTIMESARKPIKMFPASRQLQHKNSELNQQLPSRSVLKNTAQKKTKGPFSIIRDGAHTKDNFGDKASNRSLSSKEEHCVLRNKRNTENNLFRQKTPFNAQKSPTQPTQLGPEHRQNAWFLETESKQKIGSLQSAQLTSRMYRLNNTPVLDISAIPQMWNSNGSLPSAKSRADLHKKPTMECQEKAVSSQLPNNHLTQYPATVHNNYNNHEEEETEDCSTERWSSSQLPATARQPAQLHFLTDPSANEKYPSFRTLEEHYRFQYSNSDLQMQPASTMEVLMSQHKRILQKVPKVNDSHHRLFGGEQYLHDPAVRSGSQTARLDREQAAIRLQKLNSGLPRNFFPPSWVKPPVHSDNPRIMKISSEQDNRAPSFPFNGSASYCNIGCMQPQPHSDITEDQEELLQEVHGDIFEINYR